MDAALINKLIEILDKEAELYNDILKLSNNKTDIIVEGKVSELESMVKVEQTLVLQIAKLEDVREELVNAAADQLELNKQDLTISELYKHVEGELADKLNECRNRIAAVMDELKNTNILNARLIKNSLEYIDFSLNLLSAADSGTNNYGNTGVVNDGKKKSFFDIKL